MVQRPPNECSPSNVGLDLVYWTYPVHLGRLPAADDLNASFGSGTSPWEHHYTDSPRYALLRATGEAGLFQQTGLGGTPYRSWDLITPWGTSYKYHFFVDGFETGEPFLFQLGVHDRDSFRWMVTGGIACPNIIKGEYAYDPAEIEILAIETRFSHDAGCRIAAPGQLRCFFDKSVGGMHVSAGDNVYGRPLAPFAASGQPFSGTLEVLAEQVVLNTGQSLDGTPANIGATGANAPRSVAQLVNSETALYQDVDAALGRVIARRRAELSLTAVSGTTHAMSTPALVPHDYQCQQVADSNVYCWQETGACIDGSDCSSL